MTLFREFYWYMRLQKLLQFTSGFCFWIFVKYFLIHFLFCLFANCFADFLTFLICFQSFYICCIFFFLPYNFFVDFSCCICIFLLVFCYSTEFVNITQIY